MKVRFFDRVYEVKQRRGKFYYNNKKFNSLPELFNTFGIYKDVKVRYQTKTYNLRIYPTHYETDMPLKELEEEGIYLSNNNNDWFFIFFKTFLGNSGVGIYQRRVYLKSFIDLDKEIQEVRDDYKRRKEVKV